MNWNSLLAFVFGIFGQYEADMALIAAGGTATTTPVQVGTVGSKPLYARAQLCTDKTFPGG
jgi:hypothetical protein